MKESSRETRSALRCDTRSVRLGLQIPADRDEGDTRGRAGQPPRPYTDRPCGALAPSVTDSGVLWAPGSDTGTSRLSRAGFGQQEGTGLRTGTQQSSVLL